MLKERKDTYQDFLPRINKGAIQLIGIRAAESSMRRSNIAKIAVNKKNDGGLNSNNALFPIYDWKDDDVWYHIKSRKLDFPETYMDLWRIGEGRRGMRISQFFSIDTAKVLVRLNEHQPDLMERVIKREPNAYLVSLYWESEMFRRGRKNRTKEQEDKMDYKKEVLKQLRDIPSYFEGGVKRETARTMKSTLFKVSHMMSEKHYKLAYQILQAGDPKRRAIRGFLTTVTSDYAQSDYAQKDMKARKK
jgi:predicted phosphoadenosine phosphosulfate sulfurtransferase